MYGQETSRQRRSFDDIAAEVDAEFDSPKSTSRTRPSFDDIARDVDGFSTPGVLEKPVNQTVKPKPLTTSERRFADAGRAIRDIEARKNRAVSLFQEADKTPENFTAVVPETPTRGAYSMHDSSGKVLSARETLRARAEGELETANRLGAEARKKYGDLIEVGYGDDADKMSNRKWVYAKPRNEAVEYYRRPGVTERAAQSTREEIDRDVRQQQRLKEYRDDYEQSGALSKFAQRLATGYLSERPDLTPDERAELQIQRKARGMAEPPEPGFAEDFTDRVMRGALDVIPSGVAGAANIADTVYRGAQRITGNRLPAASEWGPTAETWARDVSNSLAPLLSIDPKRNEDFSSKLGSGIGSAAGFGVASKLAGLAGISTPVAVGTVGAGVGADEIVREAREAGFDPAQDPARWDRMVALAAASGMTEIFGFGKMLDRWGLKRQFTKRALETLEEGGQEALQQYLGNVNAAYVGQYDKARPLTKDVLENAILGGIVGGGTQAADVAAERMARTPQQNGDSGQTLPPEATVAPVISSSSAGFRDGRFDVNLDPNGPIRLTAVGDGSKRGQTQKNLTLTYQNGQFVLQEHVPLEQADPQNQAALVDFLERLPQRPDTPPEMAAAAKSFLPQILARLGGTALHANQPPVTSHQLSTATAPAPLFPDAQQHQAPQQNLSALDPQQRVAAMLDRLRQQQEGRKAASLEQQLNTEFAEAGALVDGAAQNWDADRATAEQLATTGAARLKTALQNLQKSESYATELGAVASGTGQPGPYIAAAQALQVKLDQAQGLFNLDAERQKAAEKAQREAEIAAEKNAREQQRAEEQTAVQQQREAAAAERRQKAQTAKEARRAQLEQQQQQARDEKARRRANDELQRLAIHDAALQAADDAGRRHQEYLNNGQAAEAINELLVQQRQIQDAIKSLPRTPEAQKNKADLNRYAGQIGNRIGDLRAQQRGRTVPVTQAIPPLLQSDAAVNPEGGVPELPSFYESGARFERLAAEQPESSDADATPILTAIRRLGGIKDDGQFSGELRQFDVRESGTTGVVNNRTGLKPDRMREALVEEGLLPEDATIDDMFQAMGQSASPRSQETISDFYERWAEEDGETNAKPSENSPQDIPEGIEPEEWAAYQRTLARYEGENPRPYDERTRPAEHGSGVSYSPYNILAANNREAVNRLYELDLNSPEAQGIITELRDYSDRNNIAPRHLGNLLNYVRNYQLDQAFWADRGLSLETVQQPVEEARQIVEDLRRQVVKEARILPPLERTAIEREVAAIDSVFDDEDMRILLERAVEGDDNAAGEFTELGARYYGLEPETAAELIRTRREDRAERRVNVRRAEGRTAQTNTESAGIRNPPRQDSRAESGNLQPLHNLLRQNPADVSDSEFDDYLRSLEDWRNENIHGEQFGGVDLPDGLERDLRRKIAFVNEERRERVKQKRLPAKHEPLPIPTPEQRAERSQLVRETRDLSAKERQARFAELRRKHRESGAAGQRLNKDQLGEKMRGQMPYPGRLQIKKQPGLTEAQRGVEAKLAADVEANLDDYLARYSERFGDRIINADNVKLLFDAFNADPGQNSAAVQTASSAVAGELFRRRVAAIPEGGSVAFLAGGPASGKSVFLEGAGSKSDLVLDTTMANVDNNARLIDGALAAGRNVAIVYVHRPAAEAARGMVRRAITEGRAVPEDYLARTHFNAQAALFETAARYQGNPRVRVAIVDNSGALGEQKVIPLAEFEKLRYNRLEDVQQQVQAAIDEEYENRQRTSRPFNEDLYRAITGNNWAGRRLGRPVRGAGNRSATRSESASGSQTQRTIPLQERETRSVGDRPAGGSGNAGRVDGPTAPPATTSAISNQELVAQANKAATSPKNDLPQPTEAQKEAGNYRMGHVSIHGLDVTIELPAGGTRSGKDSSGKEWEVKMTAHYGYIRRAPMGADGEHFDVYIGKNPASNRVFVVDQVSLKDGKFDEHKAILGTNSLEEAQALYDAHFSDGKGAQRRGAVTEMSVDEFKDWLKNGDTTKPLAFRRQTAEPLTASRPRNLDSYWKTPRVERDETGAIRNPQSVIPNSRAEFRQATQGAGTLWLNEQGALVIGAAAVEGGVMMGSERGFMGVAMSLSSVRKTLVALRARAEQYGAPVGSIVRALEEALHDAVANHQRAVVMADTATQTTVRQRKQTIREERYHQWQQTHGLLTIEIADQLHDALAEDSTYQQIQRVLLDPTDERGGYRNDPALLITEAAAKMASGQWQEYGVESESEGLDFLHRYMRAAVEKVGPHILEARIVGTARAQEVFDDVREIKGLAARNPARNGFQRRGAVLARDEGRRGASEPVPSGRSVFQGVAVEGRGRTADGRSVSGNEPETGEVIPLEGEQRIPLTPTAQEERVPIGQTEGGEVVPIGRSRRPSSSSFESEGRIEIEAPDVETVPLGQTAEQPRQTETRAEGSSGAMSYRQALRTFRQRRKAKEQQKAERAKQARLGRVSLDAGNPLVAAMRGLSETDLDGELSALGLDPAEYKTREDRMRAALLAMQEYQPDVRSDAFDRTQREIARRAANTLGATEKAAREILRTATEAITAPKEGKEAEYTEAWERLSALSARELDALKWLDSRGAEPFSTGRNPLAATMDRLRAQQVARGATVKNLIAMGVEQLRRLGYALGLNLPVTGREFTERQEAEEWAHTLAAVSSAMQKLGAPTVARAKEIVVNAFAVRNSRDFKRSMRTLADLTTAEILALRNIEVTGDYAPGAARSMSFADDPQGEPQKLANAVNRLTAPRRAAAKVSRLQAEEAQRREQEAARRQAEMDARPAASETISADLDRLARLRRATGMIEPTASGGGKGSFSFAPQTTPLRSIVTEHQPLFADPLKLQEAALDQILNAGASGTLPGARALYWAKKLKLKSAANKLASRQANFIQSVIAKTDQIIAASDAMQSAKPGSRAYVEARKKFDSARLEIANLLSRAGEYTTPAEYAAKVYKASLLSAPHIHLFNVLEQMFKLPLHYAQRMADLTVPAKLLQKRGIDYSKAVVDFRDLVPAIEAEVKGVLTGLKNAPRDIADMFRYGVTRQAAEADDADAQSSGGTDKFELGHRAKLIPGLDQVVNAIGRSHGAADIPLSNVIRASAISAQASAIARKVGKANGLSAKEIENLSAELAAQPSALMIALANDAAARFKLDYPTFAYDLLQRARELPASAFGKQADTRTGKMITATWKAAMDFIVPFSKIPLAAADTYLFRYSPVAFGRVAGRMIGKGENTGRFTGEFAKQRFAEDTAELYRQGLVGSLSWALLSALGTFGYIAFTAGREDDDERRANAKEALGIPYGTEAIIGDTAIDQKRLGPLGAAANTVTRIADASKRRFDVGTGEAESEADRLSRVAGTVGKSVFMDNPMGRGAADIAEALSARSFAAGAGNLVGSKVRGFAPGILRDIAKIQSPTRKIPDENSVLGRMRGDLQSGMPFDVGFGSRDQMQPRLDALGREVEEPNPFAFTRTVKRDPQLEEMMRLGTGPSKPRRERGESSVEFNRRVGEQGSQTQETMRRIAADPRQAERSDEAKARIYSTELTPSVMKRAAKLSDASVETEREIEALRADAYAALRTLPVYQRLKDSDKEAAREAIDAQLSKFRARAASARAREKAAQLPEFDPLVLARTAAATAGRMQIQ